MQTPTVKFCIYCGTLLPKVKVCQQCHVLIPFLSPVCPHCYSKQVQLKSYNSNVVSLRLDWWFLRFRFSIMMIFLLSLYFLIQLVMGSALTLLIPINLIPSTPIYEFFSLSVLMTSNVVLIIILSKWSSNSQQKGQQIENHFSIVFKLIGLLVVAVSFIEILVMIFDQILDVIGINPSQTSPYDNFLLNPLNILLFTLLSTIIGPIFEELVYRRYIISLIEKYSQSKMLMATISALIFSVSHSLADLLEGSLRYAILHFIVIFSLGMVLSMIFFAWGLKYAIIFHSLWNLFTLITSLLIINDFLNLVDMIAGFFLGISLIITIFTIIRYRTSIKKKFFEVNLPKKSEILFIFGNFFVIVTIEFVIPLVLLLQGQNIITEGMLLLIKIFGVILGFILINKEQTIAIGLTQSFLEHQTLHDESLSLEQEFDEKNGDRAQHTLKGENGKERKRN
jgi:membrane protease YdiL (CAAX protease family)